MCGRKKRGGKDETLERALENRKAITSRKTGMIRKANLARIKENGEKL